jgi:hypothetical protein
MAKLVSSKMLDTLSWRTYMSPEEAEIFNKRAGEFRPLTAEEWKIAVITGPKLSHVYVRIPAERYGDERVREIKLRTDSQGQVKIRELLRAIYNTYQEPLTDDERKAYEEWASKSSSEEKGEEEEEEPVFEKVEKLIDVMGDLVFFEGLAKTDEENVFRLELGS